MIGLNAHEVGGGAGSERGAVWGRLRFVIYEGVDGDIIHQVGARKRGRLGMEGQRREKTIRMPVF